MVKVKVKFNKTGLASHLGISTRTLNRHIEMILRNDKMVKKKFGKYTGLCFTPLQLKIIEDELGYEIFNEDAA